MTTDTDSRTTVALSREDRKVGGLVRDPDDPLLGVPEPERGYDYEHNSDRFEALLEFFGAIINTRKRCFRADKPAIDRVFTAALEIDPALSKQMYPSLFAAPEPEEQE